MSDFVFVDPARATSCADRLEMRGMVAGMPSEPSALWMDAPARAAQHAVANECREQRLKPKAFSYIRMSSERQSFGDSERRQLELSENYAAEHDLELDTTHRDIGVSAYQGANVLHGKMAAFLHKVEVTGEIPSGSFLLVESLDRISRAEVIDAQSLFLRIVSAGITIVTLSKTEQRVYSREKMKKDPMDLIISLLVMVRAHEESALKGERVAKRRAESRAGLRPDVQHVDDLFTRNVPAWINIDEKTGTVSVNERKANTIRRIFTMLANGTGRHKLVKILNGEKEPALGPWAKSGWQSSHIHHLLHGRLVLGEFQPHLITHEHGKRKRTPIGEPIVGYYPTIVDHDLYNRAHAMAAENRVKVGRKGNRYNNLLTAGMSRCDVCHSHMAYQDKGQKSVPNYTCSAAVRGACTNKTKYRHARFEAAILHHVSEVHADDVKPPSNRAHEIELAELVSHRDNLQSEINNIYAFVAGNRNLENTGSAEQIADRAAQKAALEPRIAALRKQINADSVAPTIRERLDFIALVRKTMAVGTDDEVYQKRASLAGALRDVVTAVVFFPEGHVDLTILSGMVAYRIQKSGEVEESWVRTGSKVGYAPPEAFYSYGPDATKNRRIADSVNRVSSNFTALAKRPAPTGGQMRASRQDGR